MGLPIPDNPPPGTQLPGSACTPGVAASFGLDAATPSFKLNIPCLPALVLPSLDLLLDFSLPKLSFPPTINLSLFFSFNLDCGGLSGGVNVFGGIDVPYGGRRPCAFDPNPDDFEAAGNY